MRGVFVTATDTGVGKTIVSAALVAAHGAVPFKPVVTGLDEPGPWDHEILGAAGGVPPEQVAPHRYGPPVSPHLAAELAGEALDLEDLVVQAHAAAGDRVAVVEGVGGLLVPLTAHHTVRDFAVSLGLPLVVAARPGLGTINHTLLTLEAARAAGLKVAAVVLTPWPDAPSAMEDSNRATIGRLGAVEVAVLPHAVDLAGVGARLPLARWILE